MEFLRELYMSQFNDEQDLQRDLDQLKHEYYNILDNFEKIITEASDLGFSRQNTTLLDLEQNVERLGKMLIAASNGLGIANKLSDKAEGKKHRAAVMSNLNRIRHRLNTLMKELEYYMGQSDMEFTPAAPRQDAAPAPTDRARVA